MIDIKTSLVKVRANMSGKKIKKSQHSQKFAQLLKLENVVAIVPSHLGQGIQEWTK